jgi:hypothetical protein
MIATAGGPLCGVLEQPAAAFPRATAAELAALPPADNENTGGLAYTGTELLRRARELEPHELALLVALEARAHRSSVPSWCPDRVGLVTSISSTAAIAAACGIHRNTFLNRFGALTLKGYLAWFHRATRCRPGAILCVALRTKEVRPWPF